MTVVSKLKELEEKKKDFLKNAPPPPTKEFSWGLFENLLNGYVKDALHESPVDWRWNSEDQTFDFELAQAVRVGGFDGVMTRTFTFNPHHDLVKELKRLYEERKRWIGTCIKTSFSGGTP